MNARIRKSPAEPLISDRCACGSIIQTHDRADFIRWTISHTRHRLADIHEYISKPSRRRPLHQIGPR